jgi:hypothetical protein
VRRRLLDLLTVLSLLVCTAIAWVWVRSARWSDNFEWTGLRGDAEYSGVAVCSARGRVFVVTLWVYGREPMFTMPDPSSLGSRWVHSDRAPSDARLLNRQCSHWFLGVGAGGTSESRPVDSPVTYMKTIRIASVPDGYLFALAALPALARLATTASAHRRRRSRCCPD